MSNEQDLTPAEARAEIEAFLGPGWLDVSADELQPNHFMRPMRYRVSVDFRQGANVHPYWFTLRGYGPTYRAAVAALKQAWRDAVRPWMQKADEQAFAEGCAYEKYRKQRTTQGERISRVLKESDHEV